MEHERTAVECRYKRAEEVEEDDEHEGQGGGWAEGTGRNGTKRHPQFRDCFSDDTLYTHGQHQPTHYGNDTCASIRINILMDVREGRERVVQRARERAQRRSKG